MRTWMWQCNAQVTISFQDKGHKHINMKVSAYGAEVCLPGKR